MKNLILIVTLVLGFITSAHADNEGIKVHGNWQFDIYNKDGSFDRKVEFENALVNDGGDLLASLLTSTDAMGYWNVLLHSPSSICENNAPPCEMEDGRNGNFHEYELEINKVNASVQLTGNVIIFSDGQITAVETEIQPCNGPSTPTSCSPFAFTYKTFTYKDLSSSPVAVQAGQTVNVKVTISFS